MSEREDEATIVSVEELRQLSEALWHVVLGLDHHDELDALDWYLRENPYLGGRTPLDYIREGGAEAIDYLITELIRYRMAQADQSRLSGLVNENQGE